MDEALPAACRLALPRAPWSARSWQHRGATRRCDRYAVYPPGHAVIHVSPRIIVPTAHFYRPYYAFRPRVSLGLGLWVGYPVVYPYYYGSPYGYPYPAPNPYAYGYPAPAYGYPAPYPPSGYPASSYPPSGYPPSGASIPGYPTQPPAQGSVGVQSQEQPAWGGVSFEIIPSTRLRYSWTGRTCRHRGRLWSDVAAARAEAGAPSHRHPSIRLSHDVVRYGRDAGSGHPVFGDVADGAELLSGRFEPRLSTAPPWW